MSNSKWIVTLAAPTTVDDVLRNPVEGSLTVSEVEAERLFNNGLLTGEPTPADDPSGDDEEHDDDDADGLSAMTLADLGILVTKEGVPLGGATKKADIIAAIRSHREPAA